MAYTNIDDPSAHFQATTYTGNGSNAHVVTNTGNSDLQADMIWVKTRSASGPPVVYDTNRRPSGTPFSGSLYGLPLGENYGTGAEGTGPYGPTAIGSNSVTMNQYDFINKNSETFVSWNWKANGGTTTSVSASGTGANCINASTHQVNQDAGFSIITYTGRADQITVHQRTNLTHGLGVAPDLTIMKKRDGTGDWVVMGKHITTSSAYSANEHLHLNTTAAISDAEYTGYIAPTSTYIYLGDALVNDTGDDYVCYAFASKQGYSKFGKYVGNGSADGPFVYTGFKPAWIMCKNATTAGDNWEIRDNKRNDFNTQGKALYPNLDAAEYNATTIATDSLSNGFKVRATDHGLNESGQTYIYMAFAEHPFVTSTGIPTTAR